MNGRNKPSYDFITTVLTKLPNLNIEWLLNANGQPYKNPEKNFRGERLDDAKTDNPDSISLLRNNDSNEEPMYENGNLFGFPESDSPAENSKAKNKNDEDLPEDMDDLPLEDEKQQYHPFPPLEDGEFERRVKYMQDAVNKEDNAKKQYAEPAENSKFEAEWPSVGHIEPSGKVEKTPPPQENKLKHEASGRQIQKVILLYSDGSFESFGE